MGRCGEIYGDIRRYTELTLMETRKPAVPHDHGRYREI
jgi:hypothetical protein